MTNASGTTNAKRGAATGRRCSSGYDVIVLPPYVKPFATSQLPMVQNVRQPPSTNVAPKIAAPHTTPTGSSRTRGGPGDVGCDEGVDEHAVACATRPIRRSREVGRHHLQQRADRAQQHDVELPRADVEMDHVDVADEHVGDRDADAAHAVQQRDLLERPAPRAREVREQHEHDDEVDERQQRTTQPCSGERLRGTAADRGRERRSGVATWRSRFAGRHVSRPARRPGARGSTRRPIPSSTTPRPIWSASPTRAWHRCAVR